MYSQSSFRSVNFLLVKTAIRRFIIQTIHYFLFSNTNSKRLTKCTTSYWNTFNFGLICQISGFESQFCIVIQNSRFKIYEKRLRMTLTDYPTWYIKRLSIINKMFSPFIYQLEIYWTFKLHFCILELKCLLNGNLFVCYRVKWDIPSIYTSFADANLSYTQFINGIKLYKWIFDDSIYENNKSIDLPNN